jgi:hypothetical protein
LERGGEMEISVREIVELENGNAEMQLDMDAEMMKFLINYAMIDIIEKNLEKVKGLYDE